MREVSLTVGALACLALLPSKGEARSRRPELSEYYWQSRTGKEPKALYFTSPDVTEKSEKKEEVSNNNRIQNNPIEKHVLQTPSQKSWFDQDNMTGDWWGLRHRLVQRGVVFSGHYFQDTAGNPAGGKTKAVRYAHEIAVGVDIDFRKLLQYNIGILHFLVTQRSGLGLNTVLPALNSVQEIYGTGQTVRLTRLSLEHHTNRCLM